MGKQGDSNAFGSEITESALDIQQTLRDLPPVCQNFIAE